MLAEKVGSIGKVQPFVFSFAEYIVQVESAKGEVSPDSIRQTMFTLYDYFFQYEWEQIWLIIQKYKKNQVKAIAHSRSGLVKSSASITNSFVRQSMAMQPKGFYFSKRYLRSNLNDCKTSGADLDDFRNLLIIQALRSLELPATADYKSAKKQYLSLMNTHHPDRFQDNPILCEQKTSLCAIFNASWSFVKDWLPQA